MAEKAAETASAKASRSKAVCELCHIRRPVLKVASLIPKLDSKAYACHSDQRLSRNSAKNASTMSSKQKSITPLQVTTSSTPAKKLPSLRAEARTRQC